MKIKIISWAIYIIINVFFGGEFLQTSKRKKKRRVGESNKGIFEMKKNQFAIS
jgi:hypothetical protein